MRNNAWQLNTLAVALLVCCGATAQTTPATSTGTQTTVTTGDSAGTASPSGTATTALSAGQTQVAGRVAAPFATLAGSSDNAVALATALRTGSQANLTTTSTDAAGAAVTTTTSIMPPTKPMGWGNVSHSLALAQFALTDAGISNPTTADLQAALLGGSVTAADGTTVTLAGVLQQRADGMGWGRIAKTYGTTMGAVNRSLHAPAVPSATTTSASSAKAASGITSKPAGVMAADGTRGSTAHAPRGVTTAAGTHVTKGLTTAGGTQGAKGLTTAAGTSGAKGITTAAGASAGQTGVVTAGGGNGNAFGRGIVTAAGGSTGSGNGALHRAGGSSGVVTAAGGSGGVTSAKGQDAHGNAHGKGKGG